jgi:hypothetical protein
LKSEPRLERLEAASRQLRRRVRRLDADELKALQQLLERVLEAEVIDRNALVELERALLS